MQVLVFWVIPLFLQSKIMSVRMCYYDLIPAVSPFLNRRGAYFSAFTCCQMMATSLGPVIGGAIAQTLSWR